MSRIDRDFLRGALLQAAEGRKRKERNRLLAFANRNDGTLDVLAWQINNQIETNLTPVPDTGHPVVDRLQWFMENLDEILAMIQKLVDFFSGLINAGVAAMVAQYSAESGIPLHTMGNVAAVSLDLSDVASADLLGEVQRRMLLSA